MPGKNWQTNYKFRDLNNSDMKKSGFSFKNIYRVLIMKPGKSGRVVTLSQGHQQSDKGMDAFLREMIQKDQLPFEAGNDMAGMLENRVIRKDRSSLTKNSISDAFFPFFSLRHIELNMAVISLAIIVTLSTGPSGNHSVNRNLSPSFLADTLIDSSGLINSQHHDSILPLP